MLFALAQLLPGWTREDIESLDMQIAYGIIDAANEAHNPDAGKNKEISEREEDEGWANLRMFAMQNGMFNPPKPNK